MLERVFGAGRRQGKEAPEVPEGSRVYAVGDIHGKIELLRDLHYMIHADAYRHQARRNVLVYLGDYIDRGEDSRAVLDLLIAAPLPGFSAVHLKGNHEDSMLRFLEDTGIGPAWLLYGGVATLLIDPQGLRRAQRELSQRLPAAHQRFLEGLRLTHEEGDYLFAHAGVRPGVPLAEQASDDLLWIREEFLRSDEDFGRVVVHGHTIADMPDVKRNRIGIDTGAFASGHLTCLVLEGAEWSFLQT
jgi:serine/threonine protein phosphatase 1